MADDPNNMEGLLRRLEAREPGAWWEFLIRYERQFLRLITIDLRGTSPHRSAPVADGLDPESVMLSTMRSVIESLGRGGGSVLKFLGPDNVIAYLRTAARHKVGERARRPAMPRLEFPAEAIAAKADPPAASWAEDIHRLLTPRQSEILRMRQDEHTQREIAEALKTSAASVNREIQAIRERLEGLRDGR